MSHRLFQIRFSVLSLCAFGIFYTGAFGQTTKNMTVLSNFKHPGTVDGSSGIWGWANPVSGKEYALMTVDNPGGLSIVDISTPTAPKEIVFFALGYNDNWQEVNSYRNTVYKISQNGGVGLQIIDMAPLNQGQLPRLIINFTKYFTTAHTLFVDSTTTPARLFVAYGATAGVIMLSLANPHDPVEIGRIAGVSHDMYARGNRLYVSTQEKATTNIWNITNPAAPLRMGIIDHKAFNGANGEPAATTSHSSAPSNDNQFLFTAEEVAGTTTKAWDISNPSAPKFVSKFVAKPNIISHNLYILGKYMYVAHNNAGLRIWDISNPAVIKEEAYHSPSTSTAVFGGTWGAYPWLPSGLLIHGDRDLGLFVIEPAPHLKQPSAIRNQNTLSSPFSIQGFQNGSISFRLNKSGPYTLSIFTQNGREVFQHRDQGVLGLQSLSLGHQILSQGIFEVRLRQNSDIFATILR